MSETMKTSTKNLLMILLSLLMIMGAAAFADVPADEQTIAEISAYAAHLNAHFPKLKLSIKPFAQTQTVGEAAMILNQLQRLEDSLYTGRVVNGPFMQLACDKPSCTGR
jgi:hypothetical protein